MPYHVGCLSTVTDDPYPSLPPIFVQVWNGKSDDSEVIFRVYGGSPPEARDRARLASEALNVHEATGLTPSQLQARVAELEAALREYRAYAYHRDAGNTLSQMRHLEKFESELERLLP